jgi:hypothetical protein
MTTLAANVTLFPRTAVLPTLDVTATAVASLTPWVIVLLLERKLADFALVNVATTVCEPTASGAVVV